MSFFRARGGTIVDHIPIHRGRRIVWLTHDVACYARTYDSQRVLVHPPDRLHLFR